MVQPWPKFYPEKDGEYYCKGQQVLFLHRGGVGILINVLGPKDTGTTFDEEIQQKKARLEELQGSLQENSVQVSVPEMEKKLAALQKKFGGKK